MPSDEIGPAGPQLRSALEGIVTMLEADGYRLDVASSGSEVTLTVTALDNACEECLVPKELFTNIVADSLQAAGVPIGVERLRLTYPID